MGARSSGVFLRHGYGERTVREVVDRQGYRGHARRTGIVQRGHLVPKHGGAVSRDMAGETHSGRNPDVVDNSTLIQAQAKVSAAIADGKLDTEGGTVLSKLLTDLGTSMERLEIEKRLAAIEERLGSKR